MSFSSDIKEQLCTVRHKCKNCACAELSGIFEFAGKYEDGGARFITENETVAKHVVKTIYDSFGDLTEYREGSRSRQFFLDNKRVIDSIVGWERSARECCKKAYVRGAFLGGGSVTDPKRGYHIEFDTRYAAQAEKLAEILRDNGIEARYTDRKDIKLVYIKECEKIADTLGFMGATGGAMELFSVQIARDMRNNINRRVNCETANADKTAKAATRQAAAIKKIKSRGKWNTISESLREIGELRLQNPDMGLKELGALANPPIGKSGVNHRLNRIIRFAEEI